MNVKFLFGALVAGGLCAALVAPASAQTISGRYNVAGGSFTTFMDTDTTTPGLQGSFNAGGFNGTINANGTQPSTLLSNSFQVSSTAGVTNPLRIEITGTGFTTLPATGTSLLGGTFFTSNLPTGGYTINLTSYYSATNVAYATTTQLGTATFMGSGSFSQNTPFFVANNASTFSITEVYVITATTPGQQATSSVSVTAQAIPFPVAGAGLVSLLICAGGLAAARRKLDANA